MSDQEFREALREFRSEETVDNELRLVNVWRRVGSPYNQDLFFVGNKVVTTRRVIGLLCTGMEGGINYWGTVTGADLADGLTMDDFREGGKFQEPGDYWWPYEIIPTIPGCATVISDTYEDKDYSLDRVALQKGLEMMQLKYPRHWHDFVSDNDDAVTGDVFIQCAVLGDIVYG